jgi:hypothetical protein
MFHRSAGFDDAIAFHQNLAWSQNAATFNIEKTRGM